MPTKTEKVVTDTAHIVRNWLQLESREISWSASQCSERCAETNKLKIRTKTEQRADNIKMRVYIKLTEDNWFLKASYMVGIIW